MSHEAGVYVAFQITKVVTDKFATYGDIEPDPKAVTFFANVNYEINKEDYSVRCIFDYGVMSHQKTFVEISVSLYYRVQPESWDNLPLIDGKKELPPGFAAHMGLAAMSTARGILHAKTEGGPFNMYFVPDLNGDGLVQRRLFIE